jgi:hypothetical protein
MKPIAREVIGRLIYARLVFKLSGNTSCRAILDVNCVALRMSSFLLDRIAIQKYFFTSER